MTRDYRTNQLDRDALLAELQAGNYHTMRGTAGGGDYTPASFEDLTGDYARRNEGAGGALSGAGRGAAMGAAAGSVVPGLGTVAGGVVGGVVGGIGGAFSKNAPTARTDFSAQDARGAVGNAYQSYLGRDASPDEVNTHLMNQGWQGGDKYVGESGLRGVIDAIAASEEAQRFAGRAPAAASGPGSGTTAPGSGMPAAAPTGSFTGGSGGVVNPYTLAPEADLAAAFQGGQRYTDFDPSTGRTGVAATGLGGYSGGGFDFAQDAGSRDIGKSAKYAFAHFASQAAAAGAPMPTTHESAEAWFTQYIAPQMNQLGFTVHQVVGDKAFISTREFPQGQWIDYLSNSGGENPGLWWGAENPGEGGGQPMGGAPVGGGGFALPGGADLTSSDLFKTLLDQARAAAAGGGPGPSTLDRNALMEMMAR